MFSTRNRTDIGVDFSRHPAFQEEDTEPCELTRQTNEWILYYGVYPTHCALISSENEIARRIAAGDRHVVGLKINQQDDKMIRRDIMRKIGDLVAQLESFAAEGLEWNKTSGRITIVLDNERVILKMYVCNETEMFHILASDSGIITEKINKVIYSIRVIYQDNDALPSFESIELTPEKWEATYPVTREQTMAHVAFPRQVENIGNPDEQPIKKRRIE